MRKELIIVFAQTEGESYEGDWVDDQRSGRGRY